MTSKPNLLPLLLLCLCLSLLLGRQAQAAPPAPNPIPHNYDGTPLFSPAEWGRMEAIKSRLGATRTLSVADMDYAARLLRTPPPASPPTMNTHWLQEQRQVMVLAELISNRPKVLTPAERRHLFDVAEPYTDSPGLVVRANSMLVIASSHDPRAAAVLERHVRADPDARNRKMAAEVLKRLQQALGKSNA